MDEELRKRLESDLLIKETRLRSLEEMSKQNRKDTLFLLIPASVLIFINILTINTIGATGISISCLCINFILLNNLTRDYRDYKYDYISKIHEVQIEIYRTKTQIELLEG